MIIVISLFIIGSIGLLIYGIFFIGSQTRTLQFKRMPTGVNIKENRPKLALFFQLSKFILLKLKKREVIAAKLAGIRSHLFPEDFISLKIALATVIPVMIYLFVNKQPLWLILGAMIGFLLPDVWLGQRIKKYKDSIQRLLPETIDLLSLCVGAGLDFTGAIRWVSEKAKPNAVIDELKIVLNEIQVGKPRLVALKDMARRVDILDVSSFVNNLVLAERMGTPVEETFGILSEDMRMRRAQRGERQALKAPLKILIPLIFCILPIIMIVIAGPVLIQFLQGGMLKGVGMK